MPRLWNNEPIGERGATVHIQPLFVSQRGDFVAFVASRRRVEKKRRKRQGWPPLLPSLARYLDNENPGDDTIRRISKETSIRDFIVFSFLLEDYAGLRDRGIIEIERRFYFHRF